MFILNEYYLFNPLCFSQINSHITVLFLLVSIWIIDGGEWPWTCLATEYPGFRPGSPSNTPGRFPLFVCWSMRKNKQTNRLDYATKHFILKCQKLWWQFHIDYTESVLLFLDKLMSSVIQTHICPWSQNFEENIEMTCLQW